MIVLQLRKGGLMGRKNLRARRWLLAGVILLAGMQGGLAAEQQGVAPAYLQAAGALYYHSWAYRRANGRWPETGQQLTTFAGAHTAGWQFDSHNYCAIRFRRVSPVKLIIHFSLAMKSGEQICSPTLRITVEDSEATAGGLRATIDLMQLISLPTPPTAQVVPAPHPDQSSLETNKQAPETKRQKFERLYFQGERHAR